MSELQKSRVAAGVHLLLGVLAVVLAVLSLIGANTNRGLQTVAATNQARIERANTFANLDNNLVQLIAKSAADNNDTALTSLLSTNGVTFRKAPEASGQESK